ncbi:hypothetical protein F511_17312 [Dorcoceras hygrometricum]|uniref:Uncharacterized protein n=1 Tax=Dorcoceras hygrometricum TaxID=472368 RepID=A0A2Z7B7G5_9LAMI|nr:hypothetical protein F511_17312 [Dorcoceras hygrometricum]
MESRFLNPYHKECMKMAMLKHEETFRDQVNELHRLYRIQKILMNEIAKNRNRPWKCLDPEDRAVEFKFPEPAGEKCRVLEVEDEQNDLELTLGPKSYNQKKIKAAEKIVASDLGPSFSSSKRTRNSTREELLSQQKWAGPEMSNLSNQERLDNPRWHFKVLSLNMA